MKIKDYKCKCGCEAFFFSDNGNQKGVYCSRCGMWLKWTDKNEQNLAMKQEEMGTSLTFEVYSTKINYIIMKDGLFFDGCNKYGVDSDGTLRVSKCKWSTELHQIYLTTYANAQKILNGIKKYDSEKYSRYKIIQIKMQTLVEKVDW